MPASLMPTREYHRLRERRRRSLTSLSTVKVMRIRPRPAYLLSTRLATPSSFLESCSLVSDKYRRIVLRVGFR